MSERWTCPNCRQVLERTDNIKVGKNKSVPNWSVVVRPDEDSKALLEGSYRGGKRVR